MDKTPSAHSIAAAVYLMVEPQEHKRIFADNPDNPALHFKDRDDAQRQIKASTLTENQRIALFTYLYLYSKLQKLDANTLALAQKALSIPKGVFINLESVINQQRIDYIHKLFKSKQRSYSEIFAEPDGFIVKMVEDVVSTEVPEEKQKLKGLKASEYEHEGDKSGLELLKSQTTFGALVKKFNEYAQEKMEIVRLTGSNYLVTEANLPHVYNALHEVCKVLDVHKAPPLYIEPGGIDAYTVGTKTPIICLSSGCLSLLNRDELLYILGHEVGHIKSGHFQYHSMANYFMGGVGALVSSVVPLLGSAIEAPMMAWFRKSELTADRAGLLACQNPDAAFTFFTKLAGYPLKYYSCINTKDILAQARAFDDLDDNLYNQFAKFINIFNSSHPWTIMRARELDIWIESGKYRSILNQKAILNSSYADLGGGRSSNISVNFNSGDNSDTGGSQKKPDSTGVTINFKK